MIFFVFIIVDNTRLIGRLGTNFPVPVEVFPVALGRAGNKKIRATEIMLRLQKGKTDAVVTENIIWFWMFVSGTSVPHRKKITGVVESGGISARSGSYWVRVGGNKLFWDDYVQ